MKLPDKVYDVLKDIVLLVLPALATFYTAIAGIWGLPFGDQISGTLTALATAIGVILKISSVQYNKNLNSNIESK